ncbi:mechanosensitive ion channel family protein [Bacteroidota bacterium]
MEKFNVTPEELFDAAVKHGSKLLLALVVLIIGLIVIKWMTKGLKKMMIRTNLDPTLVPFLKSIFNVILKALLIISVMGMVGIQMTSFIAILGAAGLAIGLALQGTLQNFAGGVMILIFKPFKVGDYIEAQGFAGSVKEIQIFNTKLTTPDNSVVIIPNSPLSTNAMKNITSLETRRIDFSFGIGYGDDIDKSKALLMKLAEANELVMQDPQPMVVVEALADSSVNLKLRVWVKTSDYWDLYFHMTETVKKEFDKAGISIPYPQQDVHLIK